jgi:lipopolysaccharide/colanic/teichoic acid biosynthesis glycosyltransferase
MYFLAYMALTIRRVVIPILVDVLIVFLSFLLAIELKPEHQGANYYTRYQLSLWIFIAVWVAVSSLFRKYHLAQQKKLSDLFSPILLANFVVLGTTAFLMYTLREAYFSRFIVFGTIGITTVIEGFLGNIYYFIHRSAELKIIENGEYRGLGISPEAEKLEALHDEEVDFREPEVQDFIRRTIIEECGEEGFHFLNRKARLNDRKTLILSTTSRFNVVSRQPTTFSTLINMRRINDIRRINKFFEAVNDRLDMGGQFIGCVETKEQRKKRIYNKFITPFNFLFYYFIDFPVKRVFPKFGMTKGLYFFITRGNNRVISRAETLGRLISCGFDVEEEGYIGPLMYFVAKKIKTPVYDMNPSYGPFVRLKRIGKDGKEIKVLKMRTMHPYAEYLQEYMYTKFNLENGGKFKNDFRISKQGRIMRKLWLDEIPMLYNWLKGEMKLFGVRPISEHYFNLYSKELQQKRIKYKPGLIPPFYADMPETLDEIQTSEMKYLDAYEKHPFRTDWKYFWKAFYNIAFKHARSR